MITSYAAMVSAFGVLLGAVVGFLGLPILFESPTAPTPSPTVTVTVTATETVSAPSGDGGPGGGSGEPGAVSSPTAQIDSRSVLWSGDILVTSARSSWDLDVAPPTSDSSQQDLWATDSILVVTKDGEIGFYNADMADASAGPQTTEAVCANSLRTQARRELNMAAGHSFCLKSGGGRTALVTVKSVREPLDATLQIKVWKDTGSEGE